MPLFGRKTPLKNIIMVDDSEYDLFFSKQALSNLGVKNPIICFEDSIEARDYLLDAKNHPSIGFVTIDINMPKLGGIELLRSLKHGVLLPLDIPIAMMTGANDIAEITESYLLGARHYIDKTMDTRIFEKHLRTLLTVIKQKIE